MLKWLFKRNGHFKETKTDLIRRALNDFNWERAFLNTVVNEKVCVSSINLISMF